MGYWIVSVLAGLLLLLLIRRVLGQKLAVKGDIRQQLATMSCPECGSKYRVENWEDLQPIHKLADSRVGFLKCESGYLLICSKCQHRRNLNRHGQETSAL